MLIYEVMAGDPAGGEPGYSVEVSLRGTYTLRWQAGLGLTSFSGSARVPSGVLRSFRPGCADSSCRVFANDTFSHWILSGEERVEFTSTPEGAENGGMEVTPSVTPLILDLLVDGVRRTSAVYFTSPEPGVGNVSPSTMPFGLVPTSPL